MNCGVADKINIYLFTLLKLGKSCGKCTVQLSYKQQQKHNLSFFGLTDLISKTDISSFSDKLNANGVEMIDLHKQDFIIIM